MFLINAVPFKCPLITQSLCKCDCNDHSRVYNCSIFKTHQAFFSLLCAMEYVNSHVQRNLYCLLKNIHVWKHNAGGWRLFPKLREHDTVVHLSTAAQICQQRDISSKRLQALLPFPPSQSTAWLASLTAIFCCFTPFFFFSFCPYYWAWSLASPQTSFVGSFGGKMNAWQTNPKGPQRTSAGRLGPRLYLQEKSSVYILKL